jgi:hypothetical protein
MATKTSPITKLAQVEHYNLDYNNKQYLVEISHDCTIDTTVMKIYEDNNRVSIEDFPIEIRNELNDLI